MDFWSSFDPSLPGYKIMFAAFTGDVSSFKEAIVSVDRNRAVSEVAKSIRDPKYNFGVIHMAATSGSLDLCNYICQDLNIDVDEVDASGQSALFYAVFSGRLEVAMYLVYLGADPNKRNMEDLRPLHCAVQTGDSAMIRCLLTCGASVDPESKQGTPLHIASLSGNDAAVQILLENQANVHNKKDGYTPLAFAILAPSISCVKRLVQAGADIRDTDDLPPMIWFSNNGLSNCIKRLLEAKADLEILSDEDIIQQEPTMIPYPLCSGACHKRARFAIGCCGRCYCTVDHLLENHPKNHPIGVPKVIYIQETEGEGATHLQIPGCVLPDCPPWWLCRIERSSDQVRLLFRSSDPTVGSSMLHSYPIGQNEPTVQF